MPRNVSASRRQFFRTAGRAAVGASALAVGGSAGRLVAADPPVAGRPPVIGAASATAPAERLGRGGVIPFPFAGFAAGDLVCLNNFGTCRRLHEGVDIGELRSLRPRVPLVACADGVISQRDDTAFDRPGRFVVLHGDDGRWYRYHHLDELAEWVEPGARVQIGEQIGTMGDTGNTTWPHLHFEVWAGNGAFRGAGTVLDPVPLLMIPPSVRLDDRVCS